MSRPDETAQNSGTTGEPSDVSTKKAQASQNETVHFTSRLEIPPSDSVLQLEKTEHPMPTGVLKSESTSLSLASDEPSTPPPTRSESTSLFASDSTNGPFRYVEPSGETPKHVKDDPFETAVMESINVGLVPLHMPRLTDPIALCTGFSMQAEVVKHASKFAKFRKAQRKAFPERESKAEEPGGGLFFASQTLGRSPAQLNASNEECFSDNLPPMQPFDYLGVDIPDVSILVPGTVSP